MNSRSLKVTLLALALVAGALAAPRPASATVQVDIGFFFDSLAPYGPWFQHPSYGWAWSPNAVAVGWQPYTTGQWVYANEVGWNWASNDPWGWATDHYGRWFLDEYYGWTWVPGYEWGPGWVDYVAYDDHIGWAPLPPAATWNMQVGFAPHYSVPYDRYVFVEPRYFGSPSWHDYAAPRAVSTRYARAGRRVTRYQGAGDWVVNRSVDFAPQAAVNFIDVASPRNLRREIRGRELTVFRPQVARNDRLEPSRRREARRGSPVAEAAQRNQRLQVSARGGGNERRLAAAQRVERPRASAPVHRPERRIARAQAGDAPRTAARLNGRDRQVVARAQRLDRARRPATVREQPRHGRQQVTSPRAERRPQMLAERNVARRAAAVERGGRERERQVSGGRPQRQQVARAEPSAQRHERVAGTKPGRQKGRAGRG